MLNVKDCGRERVIKLGYKSSMNWSIAQALTSKFLTLLLLIPAYAGPVEDAIKTSDKIFLYLYTPNCGACKEFNSYYMEYARKYGKDCKFLKINASTQYGARTGMAVGLKYVPWVVLIDSKKKTRKHLQWECLSYHACAIKAIESFINE